MPVDTALKRGSAINVSAPWRSFLSIPDGTIAAADRQAAARLYTGVLAAAPAAASGDERPYVRVVTSTTRDTMKVRRTTSNTRTVPMFRESTDATVALPEVFVVADSFTDAPIVRID